MTWKECSLLTDPYNQNYTYLSHLIPSILFNDFVLKFILKCKLPKYFSNKFQGDEITQRINL